MSEEQKNEKKWKDRLRDNYRLVIMNHDTFEEVGSYQLSLLNVYIIVSSVVVGVALLVFSIIFFTPVKRYIPGYGSVEEHAELMRMNKQLQKMEEELVAQKEYTDNFRRILVGNIENPEVDETQEEADFVDSLQSVERIEEDEVLRKEIEAEELIQERELRTKTANYTPREIPLEQLYFIPPVSGVISAPFQADIQHFGVDVLAPKNTPVKSAMDGYVFMADWTVETGHTIGVQHAHNLISFYKHNSALLKQTGDYIKAGEALAIIGNTGTLSSGPHLHFELWHNGKPVNPSLYINLE